MKPIWGIEWNGVKLVDEETGHIREFESVWAAQEVIDEWTGGGTMEVTVLRLIDNGSEP